MNFCPLCYGNIEESGGAYTGFERGFVCLRCQSEFSSKGTLTVQRNAFMAKAAASSNVVLEGEDICDEIETSFAPPNPNDNSSSMDAVRRNYENAQLNMPDPPDFDPALRIDYNRIISKSVIGVGQVRLGEFVLCYPGVPVEWHVKPEDLPKAELATVCMHRNCPNYLMRPCHG